MNPSATDPILPPKNTCIGVQAEPFSEDATRGLPPGIVRRAIKNIELTPLALKVRPARLDASWPNENTKVALHAPDKDPFVRHELDFHGMIFAATGTRRMGIRVTHGKSARSCMDTSECIQIESPTECERMMDRHIFSWREWMPKMRGGA